MKKIHKVRLISLFVLGSVFMPCSSDGIDVFFNIVSKIDVNTIESVIETTSSVAKASESITPEDEYILGRSAAAIIIKDNKIYSSTKKTKYANKICSALVVNSEKPYLYNGYRVAILDSEDLNAISTPGGHIFISKAIFDICDSEDTLAAVIAHEVAHIQLEHSKKAIKSSRWTDVAIKTVNTIDSIENDRETGKLINESSAEFVNKTMTQGYSKTQEYAADELAVKLLYDAGYNPNAMLELLEILKEKQGGKTTLDKTHPSAKDRITKAKKVLAKAPFNSSESNEDDRKARFEANR